MCAMFSATGVLFMVSVQPAGPYRVLCAEEAVRFPKLLDDL